MTETCSAGETEGEAIHMESVLQYFRMFLYVLEANIIRLHFICKILGFHGGDYEESSLLGYGAVTVFLLELHILLL
jgi:hypothetical protein